MLYYSDSETNLLLSSFSVQQSPAGTWTHRKVSSRLLSVYEELPQAGLLFAHRTQIHWLVPVDCFIQRRYLPLRTEMDHRLLLIRRVPCHFSCQPKSCRHGRNCTPRTRPHRERNKTEKLQGTYLLHGSGHRSRRRSLSQGSSNDLFFWAICHNWKCCCIYTFSSDTTLIEILFI